MTNTQTRAGKKLSAATKKQLNDANDHLAARHGTP